MPLAATPPPKDQEAASFELQKRKPRYEGRSQAAPLKRNKPDSDDDEFGVAALTGPLHDAFSSEHDKSATSSPAHLSIGRTRIRRLSGPTNPAYMDGRDESHEDSDSDSISPIDGLCDPNLSGLIPPHPSNLVEPKLQAHHSGFHVITSGTQVGITTIKGIADARLICDDSSSMTFSTWRQAKAYYDVCFTDDSVKIQSPRVQTPVQSPARKRQRCTRPTSRQYTPLSFPSSPDVPPKSARIAQRLTNRHRRIVFLEYSSDEEPKPGNNTTSGADTDSVIEISDEDEEVKPGNNITSRADTDSVIEISDEDEEAKPGNNVTSRAPITNTHRVIEISDSDSDEVEDEEEVKYKPHKGYTKLDPDTLRRELRIISEFRRGRF